jgi:hypothetical protein
MKTEMAQADYDILVKFAMSLYSENKHLRSELQALKNAKNATDDRNAVQKREKCDM